MLNINYGLEYNETILKPLENSVGIIAYCDKDWRRNQSSPSSVIHLIKTISSLQKYVNDIYVCYVCDLIIVDFLQSMFNGINLIPLNIDQELDNDVWVYPVGKYALLNDFWHNYSYVIFTESDQVFMTRNFELIVQNLNEYNYISPHRFERVYNNCNKRKKLLKYNQIDYSLFNEPNCKSDNLFLCQNFVESYGAAWVAKKEAVCKADFNQNNNNALHIPCASMFQSLQSLKTSNFYDFFVDHLSGYKNSLMKSNIDYEQFPICW